LYQGDTVRETRLSVRDITSQYITTNGQLYTVSADTEEDCVWRIMAVEQGEGKEDEFQKKHRHRARGGVGNRDGTLQVILYMIHKSSPSQLHRNTGAPENKSAMQFSAAPCV
jgi:hypothetical protein